MHKSVNLAKSKEKSRFIAAYKRQLEFVEPEDDFWFNMLQYNEDRPRGRELIEFFFPTKAAARAAKLDDFQLVPQIGATRIKYVGPVPGVEKRWLTGIEPSEYVRAGLSREKVPA